MPLYENAERVIRANLEQFRPDVKVRPVAIGTLSPAQLAAIHARSKRKTAFHWLLRKCSSLVVTSTRAA